VSSEDGMSPEFPRNIFHEMEQQEILAFSNTTESFWDKKIKCSCTSLSNIEQNCTRVTRSLLITKPQELGHNLRTENKLEENMCKVQYLYLLSFYRS
jgi:hypothetical protein